MPLSGCTWFKQSGFLLRSNGAAVYIDPWGVKDGSPPADVLMITHAHFDHYSPEDIERVVGAHTSIFAPTDVAAELTGNVTPVAPGDSFEAAGIRAQAVPAYNIVEERLSFHPRSRGWVGYVFEIGDATYYHAGDTDHLPELEAIRSDVSFVPIGGTYTMDPEQAGGFVRLQAPKLAVPMHFGHVEGVGVKGDAERFREAAAPIPVEVLVAEAPQAE